MPAPRLENRKVKIPKPTLEHHRQRMGKGVEPNKFGPNPNSSSCLLFISGGVALPLSYFILYRVQDCAHHVNLSFLLEEGLSMKDSLDRVHSVFESPNREERGQACGLKFIARAMI